MLNDCDVFEGESHWKRVMEIILDPQAKGRIETRTEEQNSHDSVTRIAAEGALRSGRSRHSTYRRGTQAYNILESNRCFKL